MSGQFWAGTVPSWAWVLGGLLGVLLVLLGVWAGTGRRDRAYDEGYDDCDADRAEAAIKALAAKVLPPPEVAHEERLVIEPGWFRGPSVIAEDSSSPVPVWSVPLEYPPAEPAYAWEPWSLSADTSLMEDVRAMIANADAAPSVRWLAALEAGQ
jgi:hypothetical protein